jgi:outer membrane lipoprotein-sorting protein
MSLKNTGLRILCLALPLSLLTASTRAGEGTPPDAASLYSSVKARYSGLRTYQSKLSATVTAAKDAEIKLEGEISAEFPDKWKIKLFPAGKPEKICYFSLSDGKYLWQLKHNTPCLNKGQAVEKSSYSKSSAPPGHFFPVFSDYAGAQLKMKRDGNLEIISATAAADRKNGEFDGVDIFIDPAKMEIEKLRFTGPDGAQKMIISFSAVSINNALPDDTFKYVEIPGFQVISFDKSLDDDVRKRPAKQQAPADKTKN